MTEILHEAKQTYCMKTWADILHEDVLGRHIA